MRIVDRTKQHFLIKEFSMHAFNLGHGGGGFIVLVILFVGLLIAARRS